MLLLLVLAGSLPLFSQVVKYANHKERVVAITDRSLFVAGEAVHFSAFLLSDDEVNGTALSKVLYCELIASDGKKISGDKFPVNDRFASGMLTIPEETVSGVYFLRFYTRFMRSGTTAGYKNILLKVVNPDKTEVLPGNNEISTREPDSSGSGEQNNGWSIDLGQGKTRFVPRETVSISIKQKGMQKKSLMSSLSVVPAIAASHFMLSEKPFADTVKHEFWYPETRGLTLSGRIIDKGKEKTVPGLKVNLSIIGDKDILVTHSDSAGRFFFPLPEYTGGMDIFLSADEREGTVPEILIDNDFCPRPLNLTSPRFHLSEGEVKTAYHLAVNTRVSTFFRVKEQVPASIDSSVPLSFYGYPRQVIPIDKYIELPTLQEYFTELSLSVKLRKSGGKKQFWFISNQPEMKMFDPLLMVDWVAVNDIEKVLSISPLALDRIELVNSTYIKGNTLYGGIVSFVSKKNNFAGIDLPASGKFINYKFYTESFETLLNNAPPAHVPDARNTLFWAPVVDFGDDGTTNVSFTSPDTPGDYLILLTSINSDGTTSVVKETFTVTAK
jgi:hypothetical protein